jgi:hypothetical protein
MRLRSALEDFEDNTLAAVPGLFGKLSYLAALHDGNGAYSHWGLERVYGQEVARGAMNAAHRMLLSRILRTPLRILAGDVTASSASRQQPAGVLLSSLTSNQSLPKSPPTASQVHFRSVLHALSAVAESRSTASHPNA